MEAELSSQPNVILIMADDMGFSDIGCYGSEIETPNLDRLGANGVRFSQFYNYARCCPTRASLQTGLYPHKAGIGHMVGDYNLPGYRGFLNRNCVTIAEALKPAGYTTLMVGKWHIGGSFRFSELESIRAGEEGYPRPLDRGYDRFWGTLSGGGSYFSTHALYDNNEAIEPEGDDFYYTDKISDAASGFIDEYGPDNKPFFMHVCYTAPHWPLHALEEDIDKYRNKYICGWDQLRENRYEELIGSKLLDSKWALSPRDADSRPWDSVTKQDWEDARMAVYAAQIDRMDQGIGRIMASLRKHNIERDTLVMFLSDNGGCAELLGEDGVKAFHAAETKNGDPIRYGNVPDLTPGTDTTFMSYDLPWANASDTPFRYFKHYVHEGGISTPFIAHWPDKITPGRIEHSPAAVIDFLPTIIDAAGTTYPTTYDGNDIHSVDGESFLPALTGNNWHRNDPIYWEHEGNCAVRLDNWKLVSKWPGDWELYDLSVDRTELNNLAEQSPDRVDQLSGMHSDWANRSNVEPWDKVLATPGAAPFKIWLQDNDPIYPK